MRIFVVQCYVHTCMVKCPCQEISSLKHVMFAPGL
jgi:hypothetical protein